MVAVSSPQEVLAVRHGQYAMPRMDAFHGTAVPAPACAITLGYYFWVILTEERPVIVDTGFRPEVAMRRGRTVTEPVTGLWRRLGIHPSDEIDVVLTHAHYDHIGNVGWFLQPRAHMARAEYEYWTAEPPHATEERALVEEDEIEVLERLHAAGSLHLIDRDTDLQPGIRLITAPGHTPGQLMVRVDTGGDRILLTSDAVHFDEELRHDRPFRHMTDLDESRRTYERIRALRDAHEVDLIVSGHDDSVSRTYPTAVGPLRGHAVALRREPAASRETHYRK